MVSYQKIYNPKSGRFVNVNGKLGKQVLRLYLLAQNGGGKKTVTNKRFKNSLGILNWTGPKIIGEKIKKDIQKVERCARAKCKKVVREYKKCNRSKNPEQCVKQNAKKNFKQIKRCADKCDLAGFQKKMLQVTAKEIMKRINSKK